MRSQIFDYMRGLSPQMNQNAQSLASGLTSAAGSSFYPAAQRFAEGTMGGNYLAGSPQLDKAMAANQGQAMASAANENARIKSEMGKNGMDMSTANNQAAQANTTAAATDAARTNAATYLNNYQTERANQNAAPSIFQAAQSAPLNYLSQVSGALMNPLQQQGNMLSALSSGGQVITPNTNETYTPSMGANVMQGIGAAGSMAGMLKNLIGGGGSGGM